MIPYARQNINDQDIESVIDVLRSDWLTQGPMVPEFESAVTKYCKVNYAVAVCNATSALHLACLVLELGPGDVLWTSPNTFVASANCALYCNAKVDFVDIDPDTYNISIPKLEEKLRDAKKSGQLPKVVIPVHFSGQSCDMREIHSLSKEYGFKVIEDASHAIGGEYLSKPIGCCEYSDITVFSFHPVKIITTGEGGMAVTNDEMLADKMRRLRSHGITRDTDIMLGKSDGPWYYQQLELGFNYRMTDIQAALGVSQISRLKDFVNRRKYLADRYDSMLSDLPVITPWRDPDVSSSHHLYVIRLKDEKPEQSRKKIYETFINKGVRVNVHYIPVHLQPYYRKLGFNPGDYIEAEKAYNNILSLPMYYDLKNDEQDFVVSVLKDAL